MTAAEPIENVDDIAPGARIVAFIPIEGFVEGHGYRVAFVVEGEPFFRWSGTWPYDGGPDAVMPWFWGPTYEDARAAAIEHNAKLGIDEKTAALIVLASMSAGTPAPDQQPDFLPWTVVALTARRFQDAKIRKVAVVLPSTGRGPEGMVRIQVWSHASRTWTAPQYESPNSLGKAPAEWPQTKAARGAVEGLKRGKPARRTVR